jgi:hypothetical protein
VAIFAALAEPIGKALPASLLAGRPVVLAMAGLPGYYTFVRLVEQRQPAELLGRSAPLELLAGIIAGAILISTTVAILYALGIYAVAGRNALGVMVLPLTTAVMAGAVEELILRGVVFRIVEEWLGSAVAIAGSAAPIWRGAYREPWQQSSQRHCYCTGGRCNACGCIYADAPNLVCSRHSYCVELRSGANGNLAHRRYN